MTCADSTDTPLGIVQGVQVVDIDYPTCPLDLLTDFGKVHTARWGFQ